MILLVEDDSDCRESMRLLLEMRKHVVVEAANGQIALNLLTSHLPNLIITDLRMPVVDGWEFMRRYREIGYTFPLAVLSASLGTNELLPDWVTACFTKPADPEELLTFAALHDDVPRAA